MAAQVGTQHQITSSAIMRREKGKFQGTSMMQTEQGSREAYFDFLNYYIHALQFLEQSKVRAVPVPAIAGDQAAINPDIQKVFEKIFQDNSWNSPESHSGPGSTVESTTPIRDCIGSWIKKYNVSTFLDIPCGDGNWQKLIPGIDKVSYYGYDISPSAVQLAKAKNQDMANMHYGVLDLASSDPPFKADMIMVKEVIQHLPLQMGLKMLQHAKHAGIKWLVVTHCLPPRCVNKDIKAGSWFPGPNALAPPFNFVSVLEQCEHDLVLFDLRAWSGKR
jgi:SAM-dependent methyltransferase